jgi:polysaccharide export outer membrane protein
MTTIPSTPPPRGALRQSIRRLAFGLIACAAIATGVPVATAQSGPPPAATDAPQAGVARMDLQGVPAERTVPGAVRIEPVEEDYRIGTQDLLEVQVLGVQELRREARVNAKGMIGLPLLGAVRVAGLTTAEAETLIAGLYRKDHLQNPEVSVFVKEYTRQYVTLEGAVGKPGMYPLRGPTTLLQAIANAGGQGAYSDLSDVVLFRMEEGERRAIRLDVTRIRSAEAPDPYLQPGDLVVVNRSSARVALRDSFLGDVLSVLFNPFGWAKP